MTAVVLDVAADVVDGFPCAVYRLYDADGRLLYVGISDAPEVRWKDHERLTDWWHLVVTKDVQWCDNRRLAEAVERKAIETEDPIHNSRHAPSRPGAERASQRALLDDAARLAVEFRRVERAMWLAILKARVANVSDIAICNRTQQSRATLNRRYGSRGDLSVMWTGANFDEIQALRPDARLNDDGGLLLDHADGTGPVVVGINYVVHRREAE